MHGVIFFAILFVAKVIDNALSTAKTILIQRSIGYPSFPSFTDIFFIAEHSVDTPLAPTIMITSQDKISIS